MKRTPYTSLSWKEEMADTPDWAMRKTGLDLDIVEQIQHQLDLKGWTQIDLARAMGKQPSEVTKWLAAGHNFTIKTLAKLSAIFEVDLVATPLRHASMNGLNLPIGSSRSKAYTKYVNGVTTVTTEPTQELKPQTSFGFLLNGEDLLTDFIDNVVETPTGAPSYAMAA